MKTQTFKAKDVKSAINLVNEEFGDKAIILSTKKNNGLVEVEASDNDNIIVDHQKKIEENKNFSNVFLKELKPNQKKVLKNENKVSYLKKDKPDDKVEQNIKHSDTVFKKISEEIEARAKTISSVARISDELSYHTPVKLRQEKFSPEIINKLNYSFIGKNLEEGRVSFFRELSKKLASNDFSRLLKSKNIFIFGNSG